MNKIKILTWLVMINLHYFACVVQTEELHTPQSSHEGFIQALECCIGIVGRELKGIEKLNNFKMNPQFRQISMFNLVEIIAIMGIKGITPTLDVLKSMDKLCEEYYRIIDAYCRKNPGFQATEAARSCYIEDALMLSMKAKTPSIDAEMDTAAGYIDGCLIYSQEKSLQRDYFKNRLLATYTNFHLARTLVEKLQNHTNYDAIIESGIYISLLAALTREKSFNPTNPCIPKYQADIYSLFSHTLTQIINSNSITCLTSMSMISAEIALTFVNDPHLFNQSISRTIDDRVGIFESQKDIFQLIIDENERVGLLVGIGAKGIPTNVMRWYQYAIQERYPDTVRNFMEKIREDISKLSTHKSEFSQPKEQYHLIYSTFAELLLFARHAGYPKTSQVIGNFLTIQNPNPANRGYRYRGRRVGLKR